MVIRKRENLDRIESHFNWATQVILLLFAVALINARNLSDYVVASLAVVAICALGLKYLSRGDFRALRRELCMNRALLELYRDEMAIAVIEARDETRKIASELQGRLLVAKEKQLSAMAIGIESQLTELKRELAYHDERLRVLLMQRISSQMPDESDDFISCALDSIFAPLDSAPELDLS